MRASRLSGEELKETEDGFRLKQVMHGWYYLPFKEPQGTSDWWKMDHAKRERKLGPDLSIEVECMRCRTASGWIFTCTGWREHPSWIEAAVLGADHAEGEHFCMQKLKGGQILAKDGMIRFTNREDCLEIGPGFGTIPIWPGFRKRGSRSQLLHPVLYGLHGV